MPKDYVVEQGDDLYTIAARFGFHDQKKIAAANPALDREARILAPGDAVTIPDIKPRAMGAPEKRRTRFVLDLPRRTIKLTLRDSAGKPISGKDFELFAGEQRLEGTTGSDGVVAGEVSWRDRYVTLVIDGQASKLLLGTIDPTGNVGDGGASGVAQRLVLLGYAPGPLDGTDRDALSQAIASYQGDRELPITGEITPELAAKLSKETTE